MNDPLAPEDAGTAAPDSADWSDLQGQIAATLGLPRQALLDFPAIPNAVPVRNEDPPSELVALSLECLDLMDAYLSIQDAGERRRCLNFVRQVSREIKSS